MRRIFNFDQFVNEALLSPEEKERLRKEAADIGELQRAGVLDPK